MKVNFTAFIDWLPDSIVNFVTLHKQKLYICHLNLYITTTKMLYESTFS